MYEYTDKIIVYLDKQLIRRYARLKSLVTFDELNVLEAVNSLYYELDVLVRKIFLKLALHIYDNEVKNRRLRSINEMWIDELLDAYDPVSKYVFTHEEDRKAARLIEALISSTTKTKEIETAMRSMSLMLRIYADRVTDEAVLQAFTDDGEEYVQWVAEKDEKTCSVCYRRDGKVYRIDSLPPKPHIHCRCRYRRVS